MGVGGFTGSDNIQMGHNKLFNHSVLDLLAYISHVYIDWVSWVF